MAEANLLIIEDDDAIADLFITALQEEGYGVTRVSSPQAALGLFAEKGTDAFTLVLSNPFTNPQHAPYAELDRLRAATTAKIVICSGYAAALYSDYHARGYAAFLQEPFDLQTLINMVASLVNGAGE